MTITDVIFLNVCVALWALNWLAMHGLRRVDMSEDARMLSVAAHVWMAAAVVILARAVA